MLLLANWGDSKVLLCRTKMIGLQRLHKNILPAMYNKYLTCKIKCFHSKQISNNKNCDKNCDYQ